MAEVKKKFSQLDPGSVPFEGTEIIAAVQGGITKRGTISGIHGAGWWDKLKAAFVDFIAPEALHANDADTVGGETTAELHNAGALTGTAPLSVIPSELTGKNAATATSASKLTNARTITITGDATGSTTFDGSANRTITLDVTYATSAGSAGYATSAGSAGYATSAGSAGYATSAGSATSAGTAGLASSVLYQNDTFGGTSRYLFETFATTDTSGAPKIGPRVTKGTTTDNWKWVGAAATAGTAVTAGGTPNTYGATPPSANADYHGRLFYLTEGAPGLYYCARTASSTYQWIKIN